MPESSGARKLPATQGKWWLPEDEQTTCVGSLTIDDEVRLEIIGVLGKLPNWSSGGAIGLEELWGPADHAVIHGELSTGEAVTLRTAAGIARRLSIAGIGSGPDQAVFRVSDALLGAHLADPRHERFPACSMTFPGILDWAGLTGWSRCVETSTEPRDERPPSAFSYERPPDLEADLPHGGQVILRTCAQGGSGEGDVRFILHEWGALIVEPPEPLTLAEYRLDYLEPIHRLLTFARDEEVHLSQFAVRRGHDTWIDVVSGRERDQRLEWIPPQRYVVSCHGNPAVFPALIESWFTLDAKFRVALDAYFASAYRRDAPLQRLLLESMLAIEGFDRIANPVPEPERSAHAALLQRMKEQVGSATKAAKLLSRLEYAYEPSLGSRLRRQLAEEQAVIGHSGKVRGALAKDLADVRNDATHLDEGKTLDWRQLLRASDASTTLFKLMVLREVGLDSAQRFTVLRERRWTIPGQQRTFLE